MPPESLKIVIGADLKQAISAIGNLTDAMAGIGGAASEATAGLNKIPLALRPIDPAKIKALSDAVKSFKQEVASFPKNPIPDPFKNIPKGANQASLALSNVGRVAQDLPFGFIGIQNNLNPLLESFQRLKAETGSTKGAFKALGSSLVGAGGIGLALSIVSSAFVIFQNGIAGFNKKSKEAKESADELAKSIRSISSIEGEATSSVQGQLAQVSALAAAVSDSNKPYAERKRALEELKEINKAYFNDLKIEDAATGALAKTVQEYTKALVNSAIQKQFVDEIAKVAKSVAEADEKTKKAKERLERARIDEAKTVKEFSAIDADGVQISNKARKATDERVEAEKAFLEVRDSSTNLLEQQAILEDRLNKAVQVGLKFKDLTAGKTETEIDLLKQRISALKELQGLTGLDAKQQVELAQLEIQLATRDAVKLGFTQSELQQQIEGILENAFPVKTFAFELEARPEVNLQRAKLPNDLDISKAIGLDKIPLDFANPIVKQMQAIGDAMKQIELNKTLKESAELLTSVLRPAFAEIFAAVLEGRNAFEAVGSAIKSLLSRLVQAALQAAALAAIFSLIFPASKGGTNFLGAFKKFFGGGFADGGVSTGPKSGYLALLHGTELIIPMDNIGKAASSIQGAISDQPIILQPSVAVRGQDLRIMLDRVDRTNGRIF